MSKNKQKLELTWIGKDREVNLEPRILVEVPEKSYGDKNSENMLIHGDNLLALKALEQDYTGKFATYLSDEDVKNVVQYRKRDIAGYIKPQLMEHFKKEVVRFEAPDVRAFSQILEHNSYKFLQDEIYDFKETIEPASRIKSLMFEIYVCPL